MGLTLGRLSRFTWQQVYADVAGNTTVEVYKANEDANVHVIHTKTDKKFTTTYNVFGRKTDSPSEACRIYNREEKAQREGRRSPPGSVEQIRMRRSGSG